MMTLLFFLGNEVTVDNIHEQIAPLKISQDIDVAARPDSSFERKSPISYHSASAPAKWMCHVCRIYKLLKRKIFCLTFSCFFLDMYF